MMKIFYGPESTDREKFIFDRINPDEKTIILVPDQYSLQMEKDVLEYFRKKEDRCALMNLMVADFSSLGNKVVKEAGGRQPELIDKYGRHMLLSVIIDNLSDRGELGIYSRMKGKNSFAAGMNQLISEMKRYKVTAEELRTAEDVADSFLKQKMSDISRIYNEYESAIEGSFTDTEDYMAFYGKLMERSPIIQDAKIWVYGFDTFTPLNIDVLQSILANCSKLNVVMTCDRKEGGGPEGLYDLSWHVIDNLVEMAEGAGRNCSTEEITLAKATKSADTILMQASNIYSEADGVAAHITELVREKGYRYSDITVICNDMDVRGSVLKRTFDRWGIPAFADKKRKVLHQPVVRFILSFLDVIAGGYSGTAIMEMAGSGLLGWTREQEELLSNYVDEAGIRSDKWKKSFVWTGRDDFGARYSEEDLKVLNEMRSELVEITERARNEIGRRNTAAEKVEGLYAFLENDFEIRKRIGELIERQNELGLTEGAAETAQSWNMICNIFTQVRRIIGENKISNGQLADIVGAGLSEMEIGIVPVSTDVVIIGTLQRTRVSKTKTMIITAANEGVLPLQTSDSGLLTRREIDVLENMKLNVTKKDTVRRQEEQLAIHRILSLPDEELFVTCSLADGEGKSSSPSGVFNVLKDRPDVKMLNDLNGVEAAEKIVSRKGSLSFLADAMRGYLETGNIDDSWLIAMNWYEENDRIDIEKIEQGLSFDNKVETLEENLADSLYFGDRDLINVSASRLETYSGCPFKHFIQRGLKADESRGFEIDGRSRGEIYHSAIQQLSQNLMPPEGTDVTAPESPWMTITREECGEAISEIICNETKQYREGVYEAEKASQLQRKRIVETCSDIAWAMINQVRKSRTKGMRFEEPFGLGSQWLSPVEIELERGRKAVLQGRIDRIDILESKKDGQSRETARIIDYKTGNVEINKDHIESGYKLQLMIYMNAVNSARTDTGERIEPAGVFYFKINDLDVNADSDGTPEEKNESVEDRIARACKLEGILVDDENIITSMDEDIQPKMPSTVIPIRQNKDGEIKAVGSSELLSEEDFRELCNRTAEHVESICRDIQKGNIEIKPKKEKKGKTQTGEQYTACTYCSYRSICLFDTSFPNCKYDPV